ncbi:MAG: hypothetical protein GXO98_05695 [Nitrospirae bacterium]|nr:hypothetical protein [Nitrospirota bacterium]
MDKTALKSIILLVTIITIFAAISGIEVSGYTVYEGVSKDNFGRFGWLTYPWIASPYPVWNQELAKDGTLAYTIDTDFSIKNGSRTFSLINRGTPSSVTVSSCSWVAKTVQAHYSNYPDYSLTISLITPGILVETTDEVLKVNTANYDRVAFMLGGKAVIRSGASIYNAAGDGQLDENWILFYNSYNRDVPLLVVLQHFPETISLTSGDLAVYFNGPVDKAVIATPWGIDRTNKTLQWGSYLSSIIVNKMRFWSQALLAYPVSCKEYFWIEEDNQRVGIKDVYSYKIINDDWGTPVKKTAPLPPLVSFAKDKGHPVEIITAGVKDYYYPTWYGPLRGPVGTNTVKYYLPIPPVQFRAPVNMPGDDSMKTDLNNLVKTSLNYYAGGKKWWTIPDPIWTNSPQGNIDADTWMGAFAPTLMGLPFFTATTKYNLFNAADKSTHDRIVVSLVSYPYLIPDDNGPYAEDGYRTEPYTGIEYITTFLAPKQESSYPNTLYWDADEAAGTVLTSLYYYALYSGDWQTIQAGWPIIKDLAKYFEVLNDWAYLASGAREYGMGSSMDMLNAEYPGLLSYAKLAKEMNDIPTYEKALYMAVRTTIPTLMRFKFKSYAQQYGLSGGGSNEYVSGFREDGPQAFTLPANYNKKVTIQYLNNARSGTPPELVTLYLTYAWNELYDWEQTVAAKYPTTWYDSKFSIHDIYARALLGDSKSNLHYWLNYALAKALQPYPDGWASDWPGMIWPPGVGEVISRAAPYWLEDSWAPTEFIDAFYNPAEEKISLTFEATGIASFRVDGYSQWPSVAVISRPDNTVFSPVTSLAALETTPDSWYYDLSKSIPFLRIHASGGKETEVEISLATGSLSGTITYNGYAGSSALFTFELRKPGTTTIIADAAEDEDPGTPGTQVTVTMAGGTGTYALSGLPEGTYDVTIKKSNTLREIQTNVSVVQGNNTPNVDYSLRGGDANADNSVGIGDMYLLRNNWGSGNGAADFNGDGIVGVGDMYILRDNWGETGAD